MVCSRWLRIFVKNFTIIEVSSIGSHAPLILACTPIAAKNVRKVPPEPAIGIAAPGRMNIQVTFPGGGTRDDGAKREMPELEDVYPGGQLGK